MVRLGGASHEPAHGMAEGRAMLRLISGGGGRIRLFGIWGASLLFALLLLGGYGAIPGDPGHPRSRWPQASRLQREKDRATLLIFLHPCCPCSRASADELERLLVRCSTRVGAKAVIVQPQLLGSCPFLSDLTEDLSRIPGLSVVLDPGEEETRRFGVATSGHVLLFNNRGELLFSGGITPGRGERGDSAGGSALLAQILGAGPRGPDACVFGCALTGERRSTRTGQSR